MFPYKFALVVFQWRFCVNTSLHFKFPECFDVLEGTEQFLVFNLIKIVGTLLPFRISCMRHQQSFLNTSYVATKIISAICHPNSSNFINNHQNLSDWSHMRICMSDWALSELCFVWVNPSNPSTESILTSNQPNLNLSLSLSFVTLVVWGLCKV